MDLMRKQASWTIRTAEQSVVPPSTSPSQGWAVKLRLVGAVVAPVLVVLSLGVWALTRPSAAPPPAPVLDNGHQTIIGPNGPVTLHDWRDGRRWLSWWRANRAWEGAPL